MDFVRSKTTTNTDEWDLVRSAKPRYVMQHIQYDVPVYNYPQVGFHPQQYEPNDQQHLDPNRHYPQHGGHDPNQVIPIPPFHGQYQIPFNERRMLEAPHHTPGITELISRDPGDDIIYETVEPRSKVRMPSSTRFRSKSRSKSKKRRSRGDSIYSSDDSSDNDSYRSSHKHRERRSGSRGRARLVFDLDDNWANFDRRHSRSRSRPPALRGW